MSKPDVPQGRRRKQKRWQRVLFHWRLPLILVLILMVIAAVSTQMIAGGIAARQEAAKAAQAEQQAKLPTYEQAVMDALVAEQSDIKPLVSLTPEDGAAGKVTYDNETDRALLVLWTDNPNGFEKDKQASLDADTFAYAELELAKWGAQHKDVLKNQREKRLIQLLGLPEGSRGTHFVIAWVTPERVERPAYQPDAQEGSMQIEFSETTDQAFVEWFAQQSNLHYFTKPRPWTRLGYTYDWGKAGNEHYGVTEFMIRSGTKVTVTEILTNEEAITRLRKGKLSS